MGKFKSTGWRNVSFWGLFGLLFFCGAISLASIQTEKEEFWLVIGVVLIYRASLWVIDQLRASITGIYVTVLVLILRMSGL